MALLIQEGHEVTTAGEEGLLGKTDVEVGAAAKAEGMLLFTLDFEFADLRKFPPGSHPGVVLFRPQGVGPISVNRFILDPTTAPSPALQSRDKGALRVNPEQAPAFRPESRRVDLYI